MSENEAATASSEASVLENLRKGERFLLLTHENPDGDALGSLVAMHAILEGARQGQARCTSPPTSSRSPTGTGTSISRAS